MIYIADKEDFSLKSDEENISVFPFELQEKFLKTNDKNQRKNSINAYLLLANALKNEYGLSRIPPISHMRSGKPFFNKEHEAIHFNLSYTDEAAACVVSDVPKGIDIQSKKTPSDALLAQALTRKEKDVFYLSKDPSLVFTRLWAMKESYCKLIGTGISKLMLGTDFSEFIYCEDFFAHGCYFKIIENANWIASVCSKEKMHDNKDVHFISLD